VVQKGDGDTGGHGWHRAQLQQRDPEPPAVMEIELNKAPRVYVHPGKVPRRYRCPWGTKENGPGWG